MCFFFSFVSPFILSDGVAASPLDESRYVSKNVYTGEKITLKFQGASLRGALTFLADVVPELNVLISESVTGTVTMHLKQVPWDQALDLILKEKNLGVVYEGTVLRIAPLAKIRAEWEEEKRKREAERNRAIDKKPLVTEVVSVNFAKAEAIKSLLEEGDPAQGRILSRRGMALVDTRTNSLIVRDVSDNIVNVRALINRLDRPEAQVLIEARIVEISKSASEYLGINWGFNFKKGLNHSQKWALSSSSDNANTAFLDAITTTAPRARMTGTTKPSNINLMPALGAGTLPANIGFHMGSISPLLDLDIELGALEIAGKAKTISTPRVLTLNNKAAKITQGQQIPYQTTSADSGTQTEFVEASLTLEVTPKITQNRHIMMQVHATNNSVTSTTSPPPIDTKEVQTEVLAQHGETIVLGGILTNIKTGDTSGIPILKNIPLLGWLFKNRSTLDKQTELLIFITPSVVREETETETEIEIETEKETDYAETRP